MKVVLIYDLPEEEEEFREAVNSRKAHLALWKIVNEVMRPIWKHGDLNEKEQELIDRIYEDIHDVIADEGIKI